MLPLLPIALALTAAGMGANYVGSRKAENAQADAMRAERIRQGSLDKEAFDINDKARDRYKDISTQQDAKATELADMFLADADSAPAFGPAPSSDNITVRAEDRARDKARDYTEGQGRARGRMLSLGDLFGDIGVDQAQDMSQLNGVLGMKRGSQGVLPLELDAAAGEGQGWRLAGDVLGGLGSVASMGAMTGASLPGLGGILSSNAPKSAIPWLSKATNPGPFAAFRPLVGL